MMPLYDSIKIMVNTLIILIVLVVLIWILNEVRFIKLNKRLTKYTIAENKTRQSLFDIIQNGFINFRLKINKLLAKSNYFKKYSEKYNKYVDKDSINMQSGMDYVSTKFILAFLLVIILIVSQVIQNGSITISRIIIAFSLGYFALDLFLLSKKKIVDYQKKNDLLKAITIMNNAFKSGRSIVQTIKIVRNELDGPLKMEFDKMYQDLEYGLEIEEVFKRFNHRVDLPEVKYITTSLTILNQTGGNIVDVFSSIEKTVFNNKKLDEELKNLSAASIALYRILTVLPFIFIIIIYLLDPTYFMPLFTSQLGLLIIGLVVILYIGYLLVVKKIIKVKEY